MKSLIFVALIVLCSCTSENKDLILVYYEPQCAHDGRFFRELNDADGHPILVEFSDLADAQFFWNKMDSCLNRNPNTKVMAAGYYDKYSSYDPVFGCKGHKIFCVKKYTFQ